MAVVFAVLVSGAAGRRAGSAVGQRFACELGADRLDFVFVYFGVGQVSFVGFAVVLLAGLGRGVADDFGDDFARSD